MDNMENLKFFTLPGLELCPFGRPKPDAIPTELPALVLYMFYILNGHETHRYTVNSNQQLRHYMSIYSLFIGSVVVKALCNKPEGHGFEIR
jgi:hypothetical protein